MGAGPMPIHVQDLSVENLTTAIVYAENNDLYKRAQAVGQKLKSENGVQLSIDLIEKYSNFSFR